MSRRGQNTDILCAEWSERKNNPADYALGTPIEGDGAFLPGNHLLDDLAAKTPAVRPLYSRTTSFGPDKLQLPVGIGPSQVDTGVVGG